jgi:hypothetical protein
MGERACAEAVDAEARSIHPASVRSLVRERMKREGNPYASTRRIGPAGPGRLASSHRVPIGDANVKSVPGRNIGEAQGHCVGVRCPIVRVYDENHLSPRWWCLARSRRLVQPVSM